MNWPFIPVSVAHLPDGRIVGFSSTRPTTFPAGETYTYAAIYNPANNTFVNLPNVRHDMFCAGLATLGDGRIVAPGGGADVRTTSTLDMNNPNGWTQIGNMAQGRWYNTSATLPDGRMLTWWGRGANGIAEILNPLTGAWSTFNNINASSSADPNDGVDDENQWFPHLHVAPDGRLFQAGPLRTLRFIDTNGAGSVVTAGTRTVDVNRHRKLGFSVMYRPGRILFTGGRDDRYTPSVTNTAVIIDVNGASPVTTAAANMNFARAFHYLVMLPNGEVMAVLGNTSGRKFSDDGGVLTPEIWNPDTNTWRRVANIAEPRGYHGTALLMRDGRVWVGGGGLCGCGADHQNGQIFSPGYLFNADGTPAARPGINSAPAEFRAGQTFTVAGSDDITQFNLVRLQSTTHGLNSDQRYIPVTFTKTGAGQYSLTANNNANVLIPGQYWLFALNANGTPSVGFNVRVTRDGGGPALQNLAIGKAATQSSNYSALTVAAKAVDGNTNGDGEANITHTNFDAQAWWQVDLGAVSDLREIRLWNRSDCCQDRLSNFHVFVSDVPFTSNVLSAIRTQPGVLDLAFPGTATATTVFPLNRTGRYIRVQLEGTNYLQLAEVEVLGTPAANRAPSVTITAPAANATFTSGANISLTVNASDPDNNLARVEYFQGATKIGESTTAPYSFNWTNVAAGTYSLTARATDTPGLSTTSAALSITVNANRAPAVAITAPAASASFTAPATVNLTVNASDPDNNLARVEYFRGTTKIGESTTAPYSFNWTNVAAGTYSLTARATDAGGLSTTSSAVSITVNSNRAPAVAITAPANNAAFTPGANITITVNATDPDNNLQRVEYFRGTTKIGESSTAPYSFNWTNVAAGTYSLTARATDAGGLSTTSGAVSIIVSSNRPPAVAITAPANNGTFTPGANINITANASDPDNNLARVEFFAGATRLGQDTTSPYSFAWNNVAAGAYALTAVAFDRAGLSTTSAVVNITVATANRAPTVTLTAPANNANFAAPATINLTANASDPDNNLARVEFYQGTTKLGEDTTSPFAFSWTNVPAGTYSVTARAIDLAGLTANSTAANITVTAAGSNGLTGDYFDSLDFTNLRFSRTDSTVDFNWGATAPGAGITATAFSVRWSGRVIAPITGDVTFCGTSNDGMSVRINNAVVVDNYYDSASATTACGVTSMTQGTQYDIRIDFYNKGAGAQAQFRWWYPGGNFEVVPATALVPRGGSTGQSPVVTITAPAANAGFAAPANINITANATDGDGTVSLVEFFNGTTKLGEDNTAPYSFSWTNVAAGTYQIIVRATDNTGLAGTANVTVTVTNPGGTGTGLKGEYFANLDFTNLRLTRTDSTIDFNWGTTGPGSGLSGTQYAVRWTGFIEAPATEEFVLCGSSDNGIRVRIGTTVVVDGYYDHPFETFCGVVNLTRGQKTPITVEYYNNGGTGAVKLEWWHPSGSFEVVPTARLFPQ